MAFYDASVIEALQQRADLVGIISQYVPLKRVGSRFLGVCPFHNDKSPSMNVSPSMGIYKCFACGAHGNVFKFLMEHEKMDFPTAVRYVAEQSHFTLPEKEFTPAEKQKQVYHKDLGSLNQMAAHFFQDQLKKNSDIRMYLEKRGLKSETIQEFGIGWAPSEWDSLWQYAQSHGFNEKQMLEGGLASAKDSGGIFDKFRARVMIPIFSLSKKVIAFGGRTLDPANPAKYMNSPETPLYHKSSVLYGLSHSKAEIAKQNSVIFVEGYLDFLQMWQGGIRNVVAVSGTALTTEHARILMRYAKKAHLVFDGDEAGFKAAERSLPILLQHGFDVQILMLPQGEDPDSLVRDKGKAAFEERLKLSLDFIQFTAKRLQANLNSSPEIKAEFGQKIQALLLLLPDPISKAAYAQKAAQMVGVSEKLFLNHVLQSPPQNSNSTYSAPNQVQSEPPSPTLLSPLFPYEKRLLELVMGQSLLRKLALEYFDPQLLPTLQAQEILDFIFALEEESNYSTTLLYEQLPPPLQSIMASFDEATGNDEFYSQEFGQILSRIKAEYSKKQIKLATQNGDLEQLLHHKEESKKWENLWFLFGQGQDLQKLFTELFQSSSSSRND